MSHTIYDGEYQDKINITIPTSIYEKEYGMDAIKFSIYNYNTEDTYVLEQKNLIFFGKKIPLSIQDFCQSENTIMINLLCL
ncbi:hypothetical protein GCM10009129_11450 [Psychrobacter aestuarii]|uniref:Uncharacterized protein n=1 Tax=Psychrobacter aestuarii TaxID=556327 RepID=A0ABN0VRZ3_9GAMM